MVTSRLPRMTGNLAIFSGLWIQNTFLTVGPSTAGNTLQKNMMIYTLSPPALIKKKSSLCQHF